MTVPPGQSAKSVVWPVEAPALAKEPFLPLKNLTAPCPPFCEVCLSASAAVLLNKICIQFLN